MNNTEVVTEADLKGMRSEIAMASTELITITSDTDNIAVTAKRKEIKSFIKLITAYWEDLRKPARETLQKIYDKKNEDLGRVKAALEALDAPLIVYKNKKEAERLEEQARLEKEQAVRIAKEGAAAKNSIARLTGKATALIDKRRLLNEVLTKSSSTDAEVKAAQIQLSQLCIDEDKVTRKLEEQEVQAEERATVQPVYVAPPTVVVKTKKVKVPTLVNLEMLVKAAAEDANLLGILTVNMAKAKALLVNRDNIPGVTWRYEETVRGG